MSENNNGFNHASINTHKDISNDCEIEQWNIRAEKYKII